MPTHAKTIQRWYEVNPIINDAMGAWEGFHPNLRRVLAHYVEGLLKHKRLRSRYTGLSRFAPSGIVRLCHSQQRRRWYDNDEQVRMVVNRLPFVCHEDMVWLAEQIIHIRRKIDHQALKPQKMPLGSLKHLVEDTFTEKRYAI